MITLTAKAIEKIKEIADEGSIGHTCVRAKIQGGGCAGYTQDLHFEEFKQDLDEVFEFDGVTVVIDPLSLTYMDGTEIDYVVNGFNEGFKFLTPGVKTSCGCGKSVSF